MSGLVDIVGVFIKNIYHVVRLVLFHALMFGTLDIIDPAPINVFEVVSVNVALLDEVILEVIAFQTGDVNDQNPSSFFSPNKPIPYML